VIAAFVPTLDESEQYGQLDVTTSSPAWSMALLAAGSSL
jgi:hypothetical protein